MSKHDESEYHKTGQEKPEPGLTKPLYNNVGGELNDAPSADQVSEHSPRGAAEAESRAGEGPFERASGTLEPMQNVGERLSTPVDSARP